MWTWTRERRRCVGALSIRALGIGIEGVPEGWGLDTATIAALHRDPGAPHVGAVVGFYVLVGAAGCKGLVGSRGLGVGPGPGERRRLGCGGGSGRGFHEVIDTSWGRWTWNPERRRCIGAGGTRALEHAEGV